VRGGGDRVARGPASQRGSLDVPIPPHHPKWWAMKDLNLRPPACRAANRRPKGMKRQRVTAGGNPTAADGAAVNRPRRRFSMR
jgi:hypothetical protein